jgi:hypothetical protein
MAEDVQAHAPAPSWRIGAVRIAVGLAQGLAIWFLPHARDHHAWPSQTPALYAALLLVMAYVPLIVIGGLGRIRALPLALWTLASTVVLAAFGWHDIAADIWESYPAQAARLNPAFEVFLFSAVFIFVGHHLVGPADETRRWIAPYPVYFDWAWKDAVQIALAGAFVGVLWGALELGAALFKLIGIDALSQLLDQAWFSLPLTGAAFAAAVQLTDVRIALIRGVRTVGLVLLSWLLPVMTIIVVAFLAALPVTGLGRLFGTTSAATTVLSASAALIVLTSAAYQDGGGPTPAALRYAARAAGLALVPLTLIAADALWLRIRQHGLSPARIEAMVCALVAAGFAAGYAFAAIQREGPWMKPLELTNIVMARAVMVVILLIFTPIADPARLAVGDQVGRLLAGKTAPQAFDYDFLELHSGRYGVDALARLIANTNGPRNAAISHYAALAKNNEEATTEAPAPWWRQARVYPAGAALPATFIKQNQDSSPDFAPGPGIQNMTACFNSIAPCEAFVVDLDGDGAPEVLLSQGASFQGGEVLQIYKAAANGSWRSVGTMTVACPDAMAALRAGQGRLTAKTGYDLDLSGHVARVMIGDDAPCPTATPPQRAASGQSHR